MSPYQRLLLFVCLLPFLVSCKMMYRTLLGVDTTPEWQSMEKVSQRAKGYQIPEAYSFTMDTARYYQSLDAHYRAIYEAQKRTSTEPDSTVHENLMAILKDDAQPVQFRLFDKEGNEVFKLVNCYIEQAVVNMDWNVQGAFDAFPPRIDEEKLNTHYLDLNFLLKNATRVDGQKVTLAELPAADYYGVVVWNSFFVKPSRKLIGTIRERIVPREEVQLLYINNHHSEIWQAMTPAQQAKIMAEEE